MAKTKRQKKINYSKRTNWENFEKYIDRLFDWAYVDVNRHDRVNKRKNRIPKYMVTKQNTKRGYASQVKKYCKWVYTNKGEANLRFFKKSWFDEYLNQRLANDNDLSVSTVFTQISALTKFEIIVEEKWKQEKGELVQFGIIADKRVRNLLKENNIYRNLEDLKKSRPIWDINTFMAIKNELGEEYRNLWNFLGTTGMRLESALLIKKEEICINHFHIENGKAGKRSDVHLLNPELIRGPKDNVFKYLSSIKNSMQNFSEYYSAFKEERRIFDGFKKEVTIDGNKMEVNKKLSTIKTEFEKAVHEAAMKLNLSHITPHSARKFYCNSVYNYLYKLPEDQINQYLISKKDKYESTFRKELHGINSKRKYPRNIDPKSSKISPLNTFIEVLRHFTHEEKAALISSVESSHHRISIMSFYIDREVSRKTQGMNKWRI